MTIDPKYFSQHVVLGAIMINRSYYSNIEFNSKVEFFCEGFQPIFEAIVDQYDELQTQRIDTGLISKKVKIPKSKIDDIILNTQNEHTNILEHFKIVIRDYRKDLLNETVDFTLKAILADEAVDPLLEEIQNQLKDVYEVRNLNTEGYILGDAIKKTTDELQIILESPEVIGVSTGMERLDKWTGGLQPNDLVILGARPGMGKTSWLVNMFKKACTNDIPILLFTLEMSKQQIVHLLIEMETGIETQDLRSGNFSEEQLILIKKALKPFENKKWWIYDDKYYLHEILSLTRYHKRKDNVEIVGIDYVQLIEHPSSKKTGNREQQIALTSRKLKLLCGPGDCNIPIIGLAQLNRGLESRPNKRPLLSDLRESGAIEQDASVVGFLYRDNYYNTDSEFDNTEFIIAKSRMGKLGTLYMKFDKRNFTEVVKEQEPIDPNSFEGKRKKEQQKLEAQAEDDKPELNNRITRKNKDVPKGEFDDLPF